MTGDEFEISEEPPRDEHGHPIHPEKGYPICGATKSDRTTPTTHGRERDDVEYCLQRAGWGTDREVGPCRNHPVTGEQWGESNPNFKDGRASEYFKSKLSERQREVYDEVKTSMADDADPGEILAAFVTRLMLLGEHSRDAALIREARNWASDFGVLETAAEKHEVEHSGSVDADLTVPDHVAEAIASTAESNLEGSGNS